MTSLLRELVCMPKCRSRSRIMTVRPSRASARAAARPITPAPITMQSTSFEASRSRASLYDGFTSYAAVRRSEPQPVAQPPVGDARRHADPPQAMERHLRHARHGQRKRLERRAGSGLRQLRTERRAERNAAATVAETDQQVRRGRMQARIEIRGERELTVPPMRPLHAGKPRPEPQRMARQVCVVSALLLAAL